MERQVGPRIEPRGEPKFKSQPGKTGSTKNNEECPRGGKKNRKILYHRSKGKKEHLKDDAVQDSFILEVPDPCIRPVRG